MADIMEIQIGVWGCFGNSLYTLVRAFIHVVWHLSAVIFSKFLVKSRATLKPRIQDMPNTSLLFPRVVKNAGSSSSWFFNFDKDPYHISDVSESYGSNVDHIERSWGSEFVFW